MNNRAQGSGTIFTTVLVSIILMLIPLPDAIRVLRPEWALLVLIYWTMALPQRVGVGYAWIVGLIVDLLMGGALGVFAFGYALIIYIVSVVHLQLRQYPIWQQAVSIFSLMLLMQLLLLLVTPRTIEWSFGLPALMSTVLWPFNYAFLRGLRRTFHVA